VQSWFSLGILPCAMVIGYHYFVKKLVPPISSFTCNTPWKHNFCKKNSCPIFELYNLIIQHRDSAFLAMRTTTSLCTTLFDALYHRQICVTVFFYQPQINTSLITKTTIVMCPLFLAMISLGHHFAQAMCTHYESHLFACSLSKVHLQILNIKSTH